MSLVIICKIPACGTFVSSSVWEPALVIFLSYDSIIEAGKDSKDEEGWFER